jgi:hypothetical protein
MSDIRLSAHAKDMLKERDIPEEWMWRAIDTPDDTEVGADNNMHYIRSIPEHGGRFLHVVVNHHLVPKRVVTLFFDRRLGRQA